MKNQAINSQELTPAKLQALQYDLLAMQAPYHEALCNVMKVAMPLSMLINTETGGITYTYDDATQKIIGDLNYCLNKVTECFCQTNGLVQS